MRSVRVLGRSCAASLTAGGLVVLAGCGGGSTPSGSSTSVASPTSGASAVKATTSGQSSAAGSSSAGSSSAGASAAQPTVGQSIDPAALTKRMNAAMFKARTVRGTIVLRGADPVVVDMKLLSAKRADMSLRSDGQEMRIIDGKVYLPNPDSDRGWVVIDDSTRSPDGVSTRNGMTSFSKQSPVAQNELLTASTITYQGKDDIGDAYRITIPVREALKRAGATPQVTAAERTELDAMMRKAGNRTLTQQIWLDPQDRMVKMRMDMAPMLALADAQPDTTAPTTMTMTFARWGERLEITAPPADQVKQFDAVLGASSNATGSGTDSGS